MKGVNHASRKPLDNGLCTQSDFFLVRFLFSRLMCNMAFKAPDLHEKYRMANPRFWSNNKTKLGQRLLLTGYHGVFTSNEAVAQH